jgi:hypothetical protein
MDQFNLVKDKDKIKKCNRLQEKDKKSLQINIFEITLTANLTSKSPVNLLTPLIF